LKTLDWVTVCYRNTQCVNTSNTKVHP